MLFRSLGEAWNKTKAGSWWDQLFHSDRLYLAVCFRTAALAFLRECRITLPNEAFVHATVAYQPTVLDLRRHFGRPFRVTFRSHLVLEATVAPYVGETVETILCTAHLLDADARTRPLLLHITLSGPRAAARHLQVLNALGNDKRILANSTLGNFKVRRVMDLGAKTRLGLCLLMHKAGDMRDKPAAVSFDVPCLLGDAGAISRATVSTREWKQLGDAALASLDPLVVLEDIRGDSEHDWCKALAVRSAFLGFKAPQIQVSRPMGTDETKLAQWMRLRSTCPVHCAAEDADVAHLLSAGAAVLRNSEIGRASCRERV